MNFTIDIPKRLYDDIDMWCKANNIDINKYIADNLRKAIAIDKYGDLNEKVKKKTESKKKKEKKSETPKEVENNIVVNVQPEEVKTVEETVKVKVEPLPPVEEEEKEEEQQVVKKHRTLKTK